MNEETKRELTNEVMDHYAGSPVVRFEPDPSELDRAWSNHNYRIWKLVWIILGILFVISLFV